MRVFKMKQIYLDSAAATFVDPKVKEAMEPFWNQEFGNPGSFHTMGLRTKQIINDARAQVAGVLGCRDKEVIFTGSGTESINLAIKGVFRANKHKGNHIIVGATEHHAVTEVCHYLEKYEGAKITYLPVDKFGQVQPDVLEKAITDKTVLVSIMYANNEIGTINRLSELTSVTKKHRVLFHTDACQAGLLNLKVKELGVDLMTMNGSKIYAPKGVGMLYVRRGVDIHPIIHGGGQESRMRSGTENVAFIVAFATALKLIQSDKEQESKRLIELRDYLTKKLLESIPKTSLNGHPTERLPNNVNVSFLDVEGEALLAYVNEHGICASTGSACDAEDLEPSHVILALGLPYEAAHGSIRFTLSKLTTKEDIDKVCEVLPGVVKKLRQLSPVCLTMEEVYG